jgi:hypothetical protein
MQDWKVGKHHGKLFFVCHDVYVYTYNTLQCFIIIINFLLFNYMIYLKRCVESIEAIVTFGISNIDFLYMIEICDCKTGVRKLISQNATFFKVLYVFNKSCWNLVWLRYLL